MLVIIVNMMTREINQKINSNIQGPAIAQYPLKTAAEDLIIY